MARTTIEPSGAIVYRTSLLTSAQAAAFARCVTANASRFNTVQVHQSQRSRTPKFFVTFLPINPERRGDMYLQEWNKNQQRADAEGGDMIFWQDPDDSRKSWVFNPASGNTWEMYNGHCTCPHKQFRLDKAALHCKHEIERGRRYDAGTLYGTDKTSVPATGNSAETLEQRRVRIQANIARDF